MRFEWDEAKNRANVRKHGVSFEEARAAFADPFVLTKQDRIVGDELRWQSVGLVRGVLLLCVAHTSREKDGEEVIRMISARYATGKERRDYAEGEDG